LVAFKFLLEPDERQTAIQLSLALEGVTELGVGLLTVLPHPPSHSIQRVVMPSQVTTAAQSHRIANRPP
jgi:hypothetical protein